MVGNHGWQDDKACLDGVVPREESKDRVSHLSQTDSYTISGVVLPAAFC